MSLLSISADAKTIKGEKQGYLTGILYLAPASIAGVGNLCPNSSPGCRDACLYTSGRGAFPAVMKARIAKTQRFHKDRAAFMAELVSDVAALIRKAKRAGLIPVVRLNGTSDLPWENIPLDGCARGQYARNLMDAFPDVQFYDYTKSYRRAEQHATRSLPANYHLTFSRSECNDRDVRRVLESGGNVAVVFSTRKGDPLPETWNGAPVVNGDESDLRFLDGYHEGGIVVGLYAKGRARKDASGFVVQA
jgi:hypothetical protein